MAYVILTEKSKPKGYPVGPVYYSRVHGCHSKLEQATRFASFEDAQPTVRKLRAGTPDWFFSAIAL